MNIEGLNNDDTTLRRLHSNRSQTHTQTHTTHARTVLSCLVDLSDSGLLKLALVPFEESSHSQPAT